MRMDCLTGVRMVQEAWDSEDGTEGENLPKEWKVGLTVPLWKRKGDREDKNTWRGVTLLSVGSNVLARVVASRISKWSESWIAEQQSGFRKGRGTDDTLQVLRRMAEEMNKQADDWYIMAFFDIEKAYPRVCSPVEINGQKRMPGGYDQNM